MKKIITYGTFDLFHKGHYNILKRAKEMGDYLIVGVTSESYDLDRGKLNVRDPLVTRIRNVRETGFADEIIIEEYQGQKISDIQKYNIDTLVVGSDWIGKFDYLKKYCNVTYLERTKEISSTQLREENTFYNIGIVADQCNDKGNVRESKYVSGVHITGVFTEDFPLAEKYRDTYELNFATQDYGELLAKSDIVYITSENAAPQRYYEYIDQAVDCGKHVICNLSHIKESNQLEALLGKAKQKGVLICDEVIPAYLSAFYEMLWYIKGDVIGTPVSIRLNISAEDYRTDNLDEIRHLVSYILLQFFGKDIETIQCIRNESGFYEMICAMNATCIFSAGIGIKAKLDNSLEIHGTKGRCYVPGEWWNFDYYKITEYSSGKTKRYGHNIEGNGFKYVLMNVYSMLEAKRKESCKIFGEESLQLCNLEKRIFS